MPSFILESSPRPASTPCAVTLAKEHDIKGTRLEKQGGCVRWSKEDGFARAGSVVMAIIVLV